VNDPAALPEAPVLPQANPESAPQEEWPRWAVPGPYLDPAVCRAKFDRELAAFRNASERYQREGVLLVRAAYPLVTLAFTAPQLRPVPVVFGAEFDFTNYDAQPLSLRFVNPFSGERLLGRDLPPRLPDGGLWTSRREVIQTPEGPALRVTRELVVGGANDWPFLCIPGTREYHQDPYHSNDPWLAHRGTGVGTLQHLIDELVKNGIEPLRFYIAQFTLGAVGPTSVQINVADLQFGLSPDALPQP
jgi:hypothetical protein